MIVECWCGPLQRAGRTIVGCVPNSLHGNLTVALSARSVLIEGGRSTRSRAAKYCQTYEQQEWESWEATLSNHEHRSYAIEQLKIHESDPPNEGTNGIIFNSAGRCQPQFCKHGAQQSIVWQPVDKYVLILAVSCSDILMWTSTCCSDCPVLLLQTL